MRTVLGIGLALTVGTAAAGIPGESNLEVAQRYFRRAELAPQGASIRSLSYLRAEELAERVVAEDPNSAEANFLLFAARGRRLLTAGARPSIGEVWKLTALNKYLARTLELDPFHADALAAKGGLLLDLPPLLGGNVNAARRHLERAVELNPTGPGTRLCFARVLMRQGQNRAAREQVLLAAHYACVKRVPTPLAEAERLLVELGGRPL